MRSTLFFLLIVSPYLLFAKQSRHSIHALVACDTTTENIRAATAADSSRVRKFIHSIAKEVRLNPIITSLEGEALTFNNLLQWLNSTSVSPEDIVFCYLTGHGKRMPIQKTPWPLFLFPKNNDTPIDGALLIDKVRALRPKLAIILFECCNASARPQPGIKPVSKAASMVNRGLITLFRKSKGIIASCSAQPGQLSFSVLSTDSPYLTCGGIFTTCFCASVCEESDAGDTSWEKVFQKTASYCKRLSSNVTTTTQSPHYQFDQ